VSVRRRRVLVADDDPVAQLVASTALEAGGYAVTLAVDGAGAVALFGSTQPDCVVLDIVMPGVDGLEACRRIRRTPAGRDVPILVITSRDDVEAIGRAYEAGATDFLPKGSGHRLLTERVRFLLREHDVRRELLVSQGRLTAVQVMARIGHWELDPDGRTVDMSGTVGSILGDSAGAAGGLAALQEALAADDRDAFDTCIATWRSEGEPFRLDCQLRSGAYIHVQGASTAVAPGGRPALTLAIQDVTLLREAQREAHRLAFYDVLSGLPNRKRFIEVLDVIVGERQRASPLAVLGLRLRGTARLLESAGQAAVDRVIVEVSRRLHATACGPGTPGRILAHVGGSEFALALPDCDSAGAAASAAAALLAALRAPVEGSGWSMNLVAQAGIAMWPQDALTGDALLASAQATAGRAPPDAAPGYAFFSPEIQVRARRRLDIEAAVRGALERDEFRLVYQPRVELADLRARGAEALIRWRHPQLGEVSPMEFISVAEEAGLINAIGEWTLDHACREAAAWRRDLRHAVSVSVNVSSQQLAAPEALLAAVTGALERHRLPATALELELTESMIIHAGKGLLAALNGLRELGVSIALDDFGTGYSSLGYLRKLPVDCLKIDRSFVSDLAEDPSADGVLQAILALAAALRMRTVAEGIETVAQYRLLASRGCREGQGYLFSRPLEAAAFSTLLATRSLPRASELLAEAG